MLQSKFNFNVRFIIYRFLKFKFVLHMEEIKCTNSMTIYPAPLPNVCFFPEVERRDGLLVVIMVMYSRAPRVRLSPSQWLWCSFTIRLLCLPAGC
jgi:hypothetical protein